MRDLHHETSAAMRKPACSRSKVLVLLQSERPEDWKAFGTFAHRLRLQRRNVRNTFKTYSKRLEMDGFENRRAAWRSKGNLVCRHGVFFRRPQLHQCPCMVDAAVCDQTRWRHATLMASIDHDLKKLTVAPFDITRFRRLGQPQLFLTRKRPLRLGAVAAQSSRGRAKLGFVGYLLFLDIGLPEL